jgi:serine/threonine-protein phosphatase 6 regulatory ankyrin repeat subunit B
LYIGACEGGYKDIVEILIKHNVDINHACRNVHIDNQCGGMFYSTPIYYACRNGHTDIVQILLDNNCDIHGAINGACDGGYKDIVEILMKHDVDINQRGDLFDNTPIYYACRNGHTDIVQILLDNNYDIPRGAINNICMTITTGIVYWCCIKHTITLINVNIMFHQNLNNVFITSFTGLMMLTLISVVVCLIIHQYTMPVVMVIQILYRFCLTIIVTFMVLFMEPVKEVIQTLTRRHLYL